MERWEDLRRHGRVASSGSYHRSFSSSLLDAIYRSIDDGEGAAATGGGRRHREWTADSANQTHRPMLLEGSKRTTTTSSGAHNPSGNSRRLPDAAVNGQPPQRHHRGGTRRKQQQRQGERHLFAANSTSSSSDSSYGGFSSSDAEKAPPVVDHCAAAAPRPRPIRTSCPPPPEVLYRPKEKPPAEGSIGDRFRASKLYRELKKGAKTPASPGARLAGFINTLFAAARSTNKKAVVKPSSGSAAGRTGEGDASLCSSASSYSRARLSQTPSSSMGGKAAPSSGSGRGTVRFFPVSFAVDDDCRPRGHKGAYAADQYYVTRRGFPPAPAAEVRRPTREATREFIRGYEERSSGSINGLPQGDERGEFEAAALEDEDDDDTASYSSSDLFELENLDAIGFAGGELPVYETTRLAQGPGVQRKIEIR